TCEESLLLMVVQYPLRGGLSVDARRAVGGDVAVQAGRAPGSGPAHLDQDHLRVGGGELFHQAPGPAVAVRVAAHHDHRAATGASTIASTVAYASSVLPNSPPMHSRSQPAARVRTAVSGRPRTPDAPRISSASDTITPSKPSSPRSRPPSAAGDRVAGRSPVMAGTRMWA